MYRVDLNADLGEGYGIYRLCNDEEILKRVSSANIACGFHAGDPYIMDDSLGLALKYGVSIGAHTGYDDRQGFGRREIPMSLSEIRCLVIYQIGALIGLAKSRGLSLSHVKPHGALYNLAARDSLVAKTICEAVASVDSSLILLGLAKSEMATSAQKLGVRFAHEVFADRAYDDDGTLVSRSREGALIHDKNEVLRRVDKMIKAKKITSINGKEIDIQADSICVHGDTKEALDFVVALRESLESKGVVISSLDSFIA